MLLAAQLFEQKTLPPRIARFRISAACPTNGLWQFGHSISSCELYALRAAPDISCGGVPIPCINPMIGCAGEGLSAPRFDCNRWAVWDASSCFQTVPGKPAGRVVVAQ